jgi:hypothetical protein
MKETIMDQPNEDKLNQPAALYDANAEQTVSFHTERRGVMYPVKHVFSADALKDPAFLELERAKDQRLSDADVSEVDDRDAMAVTGDAFKAQLAFSMKYCVRTEGYAKAPSDKDRVYAVEQLFATGFDELPLAMGDELCPEEDDDTSTYYMNAASNGKVIRTTHEMRAASKDELAESRSLMSRVLIVKGTKFGTNDQRIPSKAKRWGELYDLMKVHVAGYADRVPLHHKVSVAIRHLKSEQKTITGN